MVSLVDDPIIVSQIFQIYFVQLRQFQVNKPSSLRRTIFYNIQIFRRKKYNIDNSKQFACFPNGDLIDGDPFWTVFL